MFPSSSVQLAEPELGEGQLATACATAPVFSSGAGAGVGAGS
jgi:hypothetical protein